MIDTDILLKKVENISLDSGSRLDLWRKIIQAVPIEAMAEIGVWKGEFSEVILRECESIKRYYLIDPWSHLDDWNKPFNVSTDKFEKIFREAMKRTEFASAKRVVLRGKLKDIIDQIPDSSLDFVYIDGDHTLRGITIDLIKIFPKVKDGGIIGGDDFTITNWQHNQEFEPTLVFPFSIYFAEAMNVSILALPYNQFFIHKSNLPYSFTDFTNKYSDTSLRLNVNKHNLFKIVLLKTLEKLKRFF